MNEYFICVISDPLNDGGEIFLWVIFMSDINNVYDISSYNNLDVRVMSIFFY